MSRAMEGKRDGNLSSEHPVHGTAMDSRTERKRESAMRRTECVRRARSVPWGERLGNDLSYPATKVAKFTISSLTIWILSCKMKV